jgi:peptidoglycan-associated lipoprotein
MKVITRFGLILLAVALLSGCESMPFGKDKDEDTGDKQAAQVEDRSGDAQAQGAAGTSFTGDPLDDPNSLLSKRVVYFDFDSSAIREDSRAVIEAHAKYLASNPGMNVVLEGHADERGTREYNVALGERRANSVRQFMVLNGVSSGQLQTVSYGEERPVATGHSESAWSLNRRVEILYAR